MFRESFPLLVACFVFTTSSVVMAKDSVRIVTYPVTGKTAAEVYDNIKKKAPRVAANATFAFTLIATKTIKPEIQTAQTCRYRSVKTSAIYIIYIPRHTELALLRAPTQRKWKNFMTYLAQHENTHHLFWQACFKDYDARAKALTASTCADLDALRETLFTQIKKGCLGQDEAFDVRFRKEVLSEPFVKEALAKN
jgi:predicted secreted Zn-dependent protease